MPKVVKRMGDINIHQNPPVMIRQKALYLLGSKDTPLLEVGCGNGEFAEMLHAKYPETEYSGIDIQMSKIEKDRTRVPEWRNDFHCMDILEHSEYLRPASTVVCFQTLEHLGTEAGDEDVQLLKRMTSGTKIIFSVPNFKSRDHKRWFSMLGWFQRYSNILWFDRIHVYRMKKNWKPIEKGSFLFRGVRK